MGMSLTLEQFCNQIKYVVEQNGLEAWVTAEIAQISVSRGHYYLELVQKSNTSDAPSAKLRCNIWSSMYDSVIRPFVDAVGGELAAGMNVRVYIRATYHTVYGLSGLIIGIDPVYTLGDIEARRRAIWTQLQEDGVVDMNKSLVLPSVIKRIAVVSASTAAGYGDFCDQLSNNSYGGAFHPTLFPAVVQGIEAERSIIQALDAIAKRAGDFDVVAIIRGGGSKMDLACFDSYLIASNIAQFPLPVITGIGHERDVSIADLVAHTSVKTPTAVAEFFIFHNAVALQHIDELYQDIKWLSANTLAQKKFLTDNLSMRLMSSVSTSLSRAKESNEKLRARLMTSAKVKLINSRHSLMTLKSSTINASRIRRETQKNLIDRFYEKILRTAESKVQQNLGRIGNLEIRLRAVDPRAVLSRGYSVTTKENGEIVTSAQELIESDVITTYFAEGKVISEVKTVHK